jgi:hypothetical protein
MDSEQNPWIVDLETGAEQQLSNLPNDFDVHDFDISSDSKEVVFERLQDRSDVRLMDLPALIEDQAAPGQQ